MDFTKQLIQSAKQALEMAKGQLEPAVVFGPKAASSAVVKIGSGLWPNPECACQSGEKASELPQD